MKIAQELRAGNVVMIDNGAAVSCSTARRCCSLYYESVFPALTPLTENWQAKYTALSQPPPP